MLFYFKCYIFLLIFFYFNNLGRPNLKIGLNLPFNINCNNYHNNLLTTSNYNKFYKKSQSPIY